MYFLLPVTYALKAARTLSDGRSLDIFEVCGVLFVAAVALLMVFVYVHPEVGKNRAVKFAYLQGYSWLPILCMLDFLKRRPSWKGPITVYTAVLFIASIPLYWFYP